MYEALSRSTSSSLKPKTLVEGPLDGSHTVYDLPCSTTGVPVVLLSDVIEVLLRCCQATVRTSSTIIYICIFFARFGAAKLPRHDKFINLALRGNMYLS